MALCQESATHLHSPDRPTTTVTSHLLGMDKQLMTDHPSCATSQGPFVNPQFSSSFQGVALPLINRSPRICQAKRSSGLVIFGSPTPPVRSGRACPVLSLAPAMYPRALSLAAIMTEGSWDHRLGTPVVRRTPSPRISPTYCGWVPTRRSTALLGSMIHQFV